MTKTQKTRSQISVENSIKIIKRAIKSKISLTEASKRSSLGKNYVSDVKANISDNYKKRNIDKETYKTFNTLIKEYDRA